MVKNEYIKVSRECEDVNWISVEHRAVGVRKEDDQRCI